MAARDEVERFQNGLGRDPSSRWRTSTIARQLFVSHQSISPGNPQDHMSDLILREIPADVLAALQARAQRHGHSCEDEVLQLIERATQEEQLLQQLDRATAAMAARLTRTEPLLAGKRRMPRRHRHDAPTPVSELQR